MFLGQYSHNLDGKGRLIIPARFRELLANGAYVTQGFDRNLMVLTPESFERIYQRVNEMSITDPAARQLKRLIFAAADRVEADRAGRIRIPQFLREIAGLNNGAIVVGVGDYFEIWAPETWQAQTTLLQDVDANSERFAALDLSAK